MQMLAANLLSPFKGGLLEISGGQRPQPVEHRHVGHGPQFPVFLRRCAQTTLAQIDPVLVSCFGHGHVHGLTAVQGQRLEVFRAHNRAGAAPAGLASTVVGDAGVTDQMLSRGADAGDPDSRTAQPFFHGLFSVEGAQAHQIGGGEELGHSVFDEEEGWGFGPAHDYQCVATGLL